MNFRGVTTAFRWLSVILIIGLGTGLASALFLLGLEKVTQVRESIPFIILGLPLIGVAMTWLYNRIGGQASQGNHLVIDRGNGQKEGIPFVMLPLALVSTWLSHLGGASVGREGTAVQMGGALAERVARLCRIPEEQIRVAIICGISGGFSSVFGTPFAGAIFAIEVLVIQKIRWRYLVPSLATALLANQITLLTGVTHSTYTVPGMPHFTILLLLKVICLGIACGLVSSAFSWVIPQIKRLYSTLVPNSYFRIASGGCVILVLTLLIGSTRYLGLSLPLLTDAFAGQHQPLDFLYKFVFTVLSLGAGYQGGEVTPLFEIGSTLGATFGQLLQVSVPFMASLGFIAVFAGATNTPIACAIMGMELFGPQVGGWLILISFVSYVSSISRGIYHHQLNQENKWTLLPRRRI